MSCISPSKYSLYFDSNILLHSGTSTLFISRVLVNKFFSVESSFKYFINISINYLKLLFSTFSQQMELVFCYCSIYWVWTETCERSIWKFYFFFHVNRLDECDIFFVIFFRQLNVFLTLNHATKYLIENIIDLTTIEMVVWNCKFDKQK